MKYCYSMIRSEGRGFGLMGQLLFDLKELSYYGVVFLERHRNHYKECVVEDFYEMFKEHITYSFLTDYSYKGGQWNSGAFVFLMNEEMQKVLVELSENSLFFRDERGQITSPFWDLCLFRKDGTLLLGTVSHELEADLYLTEEERDRLNVDIEFRKEKLEYETAELARFTIPLYDEK